MSNINYTSKGAPTFPSPANGPAICVDTVNNVIYLSNNAGGWVTAQVPAVNALTALAGGGQSGATALTGLLNRVTTVATAADSVILPKGIAGMEVTVINAAAANSMNVFPATGEAINALAANTALAVAANKTVIFSCAVNGTWNSLLTA